ncbi:MAG: transposase, partial [Fluviicola sp.]
MSKHRRNWSAEEKEKIVLYSEEHGATSASREFGISTVSIYNWRDKFAQLG